MDKATHATLMANARLAEKLDPEAGAAILACNLMRNLLGLSALAIDLKLCAAARDHSHDMQTLHFFAHESPVEGKKTPWDRAKRMGTRPAANILRASATARRPTRLVSHSPGHHANMLGAGHTRIGVGRSGTYFTEMFGD